MVKRLGDNNKQSNSTKRKIGKVNIDKDNKESIGRETTTKPSETVETTATDAEETPISEEIVEVEETKTTTVAAETESKEKLHNLLNSLEPIVPNAQRSASSNGCLCVVNNDNGKRVVINRIVIEQLGSPKKIKCYLAENGQAIVLTPLDDDGENDEEGHILKGKSKNILYSTPLVGEITRVFELNYETCTSQTVGTVEYVEKDNQIFAVITKQ